MSNKIYWKKRFEQITVDAYDDSAEYRKSLEKAYNKLLDSITTDLAKWYSKYAKNNELELSDVKKLLDTEELKDFQITLEEFKKKAIDGNFKHELDNIYYKSRISRLQALETQIKGYISELYNNQATDTDYLLSNVYKNTYYKTIYEVEKITNMHTNFAIINSEIIQSIVNKPWLEENFSSRIWKNRNTLINNLEQTLLRGLTLGYPIDKMVDEISNKCGVAKRKAMTLVETETTHILEEATAKAYEETGVDEYEYIATLEVHTCSICGELDNKIFNIKDREIGVNYPPIHARCRCTTIPYFDDEFTLDDKRIARNKEGKNIYVPSNMNFKEWSKEYIDTK